MYNRKANNYRNYRKARRIENGLRNVANQLGCNPYFKAPLQNPYSTYINTRENIYTIDRTNLNYRFCTDGIFKKIVVQRVDDALKGELNIISDLLSPEQIDELKDDINEKNIIETVKRLLYWDRLFGGAGLICEVEGQGSSELLTLSNINQGDKINYYAVDRWEFSNTPYTSSDQIKSANIDEEFYYYEHIINKSRILLLRGVAAPSLIRPILQGWGLSVVEPLIAPSNNYQKALNLVYELMDEAKVDVYKIDGLNTTLLVGEDKVVKDKLEVVNELKNFMKAIAMDSKDDFIQKQLNLTGIIDIIHELKLDICSAMDYPITKLFGTSPSGFNSGDSELRMYNSTVEAETRPYIFNILKKILKLECKCLFGIYVDDLELTLPPLETLNQEQLEGAKDREFARLMQLKDRDLIQKETLENAINRANLFNDSIELDGDEQNNMIGQQSQSVKQLDFDNV